MTNIFDRIATGDEENPKEILYEEIQPSAAGDRSVVEQDAVEGEAPLRTSTEVKEIVQELLKHGSLEESRRPDFFRRTIVHEREISTALEPLDLALRLDTHRGVAFLAVAQSAALEPNVAPVDDEGWAHPLVRRQRLTLEQSLLVAILRQAFVLHEQESGVGQSSATLAIEDLLPQFMTYLGDTGSDKKNESRLLNLLDQLKTYGIVSEVDKKHEVTIRPLIAHLANPESLTALLAVLKEQTHVADLPENTELLGNGD